MLFRFFWRLPIDFTLSALGTLTFRCLIVERWYRLGELVLRGISGINVHRQVLRPDLLGPCAVRYEGMFEYVLWIR